MIISLLLNCANAYRRDVRIENRSHNIELYNCKQLYEIHGTWDSTVTPDQVFGYGTDANIEMSSHGHGVQASLSCEYRNVSGASLAYGYLYIDVNYAGAYLDLTPIQGTLSTSVLLNANSSKYPDSYVYTIQE